MRAGFVEVDITPPVGTHKIGWLRDIVSERVLDRLYVRIVVFEQGSERVALIQLDTLSVRWSLTQEIRDRVQERYGFSGDRIMVSATHNHAGPAVATTGEVPRDEAYVGFLIGRCVEGFGEALGAMQDAELGFRHVFEFEVGYNRRVVMRDGTVKTHGRFTDPDALYVEGPIDPEVAVMAARNASGDLLGCWVNFACHPTHHGGETDLSAGYPGVLASEMKKAGCPVTLFLNGACGNVHTSDPRTGNNVSKEEAGRRLATDTQEAIESMEFRADWPLSAVSETIELPYRQASPEEVRGEIEGAQRFIDPAIYDRGMPALLERVRERGTQPAQVQIIRIGEVAVVGIPAEYFVEHGLRIKTACHPVHALVSSHTNGMVGYVPTRKAFERGGYETTFAMSSRLAPEAGDMLADTAIRLVRGLGKV